MTLVTFWHFLSNISNVQRTLSRSDYSEDFTKTLKGASRNRNFVIFENFSFVIETLDCTQGAFRTPTENKAAFRSSKWFHSINVQVICDAHYSITNVMGNISWVCHVFNVLQNLVSSSAHTMPDWKRQPLGFILFISQVPILKQTSIFLFQKMVKCLQC